MGYIYTLEVDKVIQKEYSDAKEELSITEQDFKYAAP
jgi:hypothetical protein